MSTPLQRGERVILVGVEDDWAHGPSNPVFGGEYGEIIGTTIGNSLSNWLRVRWDNGHENSYPPIGGYLRRLEEQVINEILNDMYDSPAPVVEIEAPKNFREFLNSKTQ